MHHVGLYIYSYVFWLGVYILPAAVVAFLLSYFAIKSRAAVNLIGLLLVTLLITFPPMERRGEWQKEATGQRAIAPVQIQLDRFRYGYAPHYRWIGALFTPDTPDHGRSSVIGESDYYRLLSFRYRVSLMYFIPQCGLVLLGLWILKWASNQALQRTRPMRCGGPRALPPSAPPPPAR